YVLGVRVLDDIRERALVQTVDGCLMTGRKPRGHISCLNLDLDPGTHLELARIKLDCGNDPRFIQDRRAQVKNQTSNRVDGISNQVFCLLQLSLDLESVA